MGAFHFVTILSLVPSSGLMTRVSPAPPPSSKGIFKPQEFSYGLTGWEVGKRAREDPEAGEILENAQMSDMYRARAKQRLKREG